MLSGWLSVRAVALSVLAGYLFVFCVFVFVFLCLPFFSSLCKTPGLVEGSNGLGAGPCHRGHWCRCCCSVSSVL